MKQKITWCTVLFFSFGPFLSARPPEHDCKWKPFESKALGVKMLVQKCSTPSQSYVFSVKKNSIEQHRPSDDKIFGSHQVLEVFSKPASQSIEEAIKEQFFQKLDLKAQKGCRIIPVKKSFLREKVLTYVIDSFGDYRHEIDEELRKGPRDLGCGAYGTGQMSSYFEYHPEESKTKFAFVIYGWESEKPFFDENSIEFIK